MAKSELIAGGPVKLITVHGTGAGDTSPTGDKWWQLGSAFLDEFGKRIDLDPANVEVVPFQWKDGPNSEEMRRQASRHLFAEVRKLEKSGTPYHLIGHSHGGSVIYNMLLHSVKKKTRLEHLQQWCTVGTPFLDYTKNRFMFQRLRGFGLTVFSSGLVSLLLGIVLLGTFVVLYLTGETNLDGLANVAMMLTVLGAVTLFALRINERRGNSWFLDSQKQTAHDWYSGNWLGLWHREDEAISALFNVQKVSGNIIPSTFLQPFVAIVQIVIVMAFGILFLLEVYGVFEDFGMLDTTFDLALGSAELDGVGSLKAIGGLLLALVVVVSVITFVLKILAWAVGAALAPMINKVIWVSVRERAWGDDLLKEDVRSIAAHPPEFGRRFSPLPERIATPLKAHSDGHAISTLNKVRLILGMASDGPKAPDLKTELNEALKWKELIHTSYFDVPEFIDLLALGMARGGLGASREGATPTTEASAEMQAWLDQERVNPAT